MIAIEDFFTGPFESALAHDEMLTEIRIPIPQPFSSGAYQKMERKVGDFATAAVAVQIRVDEDRVCTQAGIGLTNVGLTPIKASAAEAQPGGAPAGRRGDPRGGAAGGRSGRAAGRPARQRGV